MISPPFASPSNFTSSPFPKSEGPSLWFIFSGDQILTSLEGRHLPDQCTFPLHSNLYMGALGDLHLYIGDAEKNQAAPQGWQWEPLRVLYGTLQDELYALAGHALQLIDWDRTHKYCGCCGSLTACRETERCKVCPSCGHLSYPKLAPAIMALVQKNEHILLARSPHFPKNIYSVLAGFVEPGETLEQCVIREVYEEVGLRVGSIRYFGSQPWPFSRSLMIAFVCQWEEGDIKINPSEIEDAQWFEYAKLPELPPHISIARMLIDSLQ